MDLAKAQNENELLDRNRKFAAVFRIAKAVDGFDRRLAPHIDPVKIEINWPKIDEELTAGSERVALHWMQALSSRTSFPLVRTPYHTFGLPTVKSKKQSFAP